MRRNIFISRCKGDQDKVDKFIDRFANVEQIFSPYVLGTNDNNDFIDSNNPDYLMCEIRRKYFKDTTVAIVLISSCTHIRQYVDWEIKSSLPQGETLPNWLLRILLRIQGTSGHQPDRFKLHLEKGEDTCDIRYRSYPQTGTNLAPWIEDAHTARTSRPQFIKNPQDMMKYNQKCEVCGVTH